MGIKLRGSGFYFIGEKGTLFTPEELEELNPTKQRKEKFDEEKTNKKSNDKLVKKD